MAAVLGGGGANAWGQAQGADLNPDDEAQIRRQRELWKAAFEAGDVNRIMSFYVPGAETVAFDVLPPLQFRGAEADKPLSERVRQVIILTVGAVWKAPYGLYVHSAAARKAGLSEEIIQRLVVGVLPDDDLSAEERLAQRYVRQLSAEHRVDGTLYRAAEQAFGKRGLVDLINLVGAHHTVCALLNAFEIPAPA